MFDAKKFIPERIHCPTCGNVIKAKADSSYNEDDGYRICLEYVGKCKTCKKIYTWVEHYCYQGYNDVEQLSTLNESDFPLGYFDKN